MDSTLIWLFFFLALVIGWLLGRYLKFESRKKQETSAPPSSSIKHRLQLLFDSYSDESIDQFVQSLEVNPKTLQTHVSIGRHFRSQGEVEKAILIHQNLMSHPELSHSDTEPVIYELAKDYKAAGLYDRAEALLKQLQTSKAFGAKSVKLLLDIYEREKDWEDAFQAGLSIDFKRNQDVALRVAYHACELADEKLEQNKVIEARKLLKRAISIHKGCIRAYLSLAQLDADRKEYRSAINLLRQMAELAPENIALALPLLFEVSADTDSYDRLLAYLERLYGETGQVPVMLAIINVMIAQGKEKEAAGRITRYFESYPGVGALGCLIGMREQLDISLPEKILSSLEILVESIKKDKPSYQCVQCGFSGHQFYWLCPSCKSWQTTQPVVEYEVKNKG